MWEALLEGCLQRVVVGVAGEIRVSINCLVLGIRTQCLSQGLATRGRLKQSRTHCIVFGRKLIQVCPDIANLKSGNAEWQGLPAGTGVTDLDQCPIAERLLEVQIPLLYIRE